MALSISYYTLRKNIKLAKKKVIRVIILIFTIFAVSMIAINIILISQIIPTTVFANKVFRRPYDVIPLVLYILCIIVLYAHKKFISRLTPIYKYFIHIFILTLLFDCVIQLTMIFGSSLVLDDYFNIAHFYKIISYLLPCTILIYSIAFSNKENIDKLNKTIGAQSLFFSYNIS